MWGPRLVLYILLRLNDFPELAIPQGKETFHPIRLAMPITESSRGSLSSSGDTMESLELEIAGLDNTVEPDTSSYLLETTPYSDQRTFNILRDFLRPDRAGPSVSQAALMITNMLPDAPREYGSDDLWGLWSLFVRVAEQISPYDPLLLRLVRLVQRLGDSPKTVFTEKAVVCLPCQNASQKP